MASGNQQQQRAAKVLAALEKQIIERIDKDFFTEELKFRPLVNVIDVLSSSDGQVNNVSHERLKGQSELANMAMEKFVDENYTYLNGNVEAMGKILRKFNETFNDVKALRQQVVDCKAALLDGLKEQNIRQMWVRKKENEYILSMLDKLDMLKETPSAFDELVKDKRYLAAVTRLDNAIAAMFSSELVDVAAVAKVRDEVLQRKGRFLELVMEDVISALYLRLDKGKGTPAYKSQLSHGNSVGQAVEAGEASEGLGRRGPLSPSLTNQEKQNSIELSSRAIRIPSMMERSEQAEAAFEDPTQEVGAFMCFMVEAAKRLNCLDDVERFTQERIRDEVRLIALSHFTRAKASALNERLASARELRTAEDMTTPLVEFLRILYMDFTAIVENHVSFVRLLDHARGRPDHIGVAPLVAAVWKEMQDYVQEFLYTHIRAEDTEFYLSPDALQESETPKSTNRPKWALNLPKGLQGLPLDLALEKMGGLALPLLAGQGGKSTMTFNPHFFSMSLADVLNNGEDKNDKKKTQREAAAPDVLASPEVMNVVPVYRPTLKFVTKILAIIGSTGESALTRGVVRYLSDFVTETLIPYLSGQTNTLLRKILEDKDALTPVQTDRQAQIKVANKGARRVLELCRSLNVYTTQLPQHVNKIFVILHVALDCYLRRIREELQSTIAGTHAADISKVAMCDGIDLRMDQWTDLGRKYLSVLVKDPVFQAYKAYWRDQGATDPAAKDTPQSPAEEISLDAFEQFTQLRPELWKLDVNPFPISRNGITLDKKRLLMVASLAYSADWLGSEVRKLRSVGKTRNRRGSGGSRPQGKGDWVDKISTELFQFSEQCLLFLRLEVDYSCFYYMQQLPASKFDLTPAPSNSKQHSSFSAASSKSVEICVASLNRYLLSLEDAICGVASTEYFAVAVADVPRLLPRLLIHSIRYISKVSPEGMDKLSRVFVAMQQTVPILVDGFGTAIGEQAGLTHDVIADDIARVRAYVSLIDMDDERLTEYVRLHKHHFSKEEYRAVWMLRSGTPSGPDSTARFNAAWQG